MVTILTSLSVGSIADPNSPPLMDSQTNTQQSLQEISDSDQELSLSVDDPDFDRALMNFSSTQFRDFQRHWAETPRAAMYSGPSLSADSKSLLSAVPYLGKKRDQGNCGNCWVWASVAALEVANSINNNISDQLSVQYINSNWNNGSASDNACLGGWTGDAASFVNDTLHQMIPWSNTNASYADYYFKSGNTSGMPASSIATSPHYQISKVTDNIIWVYDGQNAAINTIKSNINAGIPVIYTFYLPKDGWTKFRSFWKNESETTIWNPDLYSGTERTGGHSTLIIGYDDTGSTPYWTVLNSWAIRDNRPNGLFRVKLDMNYNGTTIDEGEEYWANYYETFSTTYAPVKQGSGTLTVTSNPSTASIIIDNQSTGFRTPRTIPDIPSGVHSLKLVKQGYFDSTQPFSIVTDQNTTVTPTLTPGGFLSVSSKPTGAAIWIDGINTGRVTKSMITPLTLGTHTLTLVKPGFGNYSTDVTITSGVTTTVFGTLSQTGGSVAVSSNPSGAVIFIDQVDTGYQTPQTVQGLSPGTHTLLLKKDLFWDWTTIVQIKALITTPVDTALQAGGNNGSLFVSSNPSGANIILNGKNTGYRTTKKIVGIPAGQHTITLSKDGYQDWSDITVVKKGITTTVSGKLSQ